MPDMPLSLARPTNELRRDREVVGLTDRVYEITGDQVTFDEVIVKGDLSGPLVYNDHVVEVTHIDTAIGLEVGERGVRGPIWKTVRCRVIQ
jgi:hypothetical protein